MRGLIPALLYLGIGALLHALFAGSQFDFQSAWTWGWLLVWPLMLGFWLLLFGAVVAAVIVVWELATGRL